MEKENESHNYGKDFYLTENLELVKEWAVCRTDQNNGYVHKNKLDIGDLKIRN